jgi:hypothetical protein
MGPHSDATWQVNGHLVAHNIEADLKGEPLAKYTRRRLTQCPRSPLHPCTLRTVACARTLTTCMRALFSLWRELWVVAHVHPLLTVACALYGVCPLSLLAVQVPKRRHWRRVDAEDLLPLTG